MGAVFGFTGAPNAKLFGRMKASLAHRGTQCRVFQGSEATVGYLSPIYTSPRDDYPTGWFDLGHRQRAIAISGFVTSLGRRAFEADAQLEAMFSELGPDHYWEGDYVAVLLDHGRIRVIRDPAGCRSVYFGRHANRHVFASEPKAIWCLPEFRRRVLPQSIAQYLTFSFVPGAATMLEGIRALPAGHSIDLIAGGEYELRRYFEVERHEFQPAEFRTKSSDGDTSNVSSIDDMFVRDFRHRFTASVLQRLPTADPPIVFLSGGLDSSVVTAELSEHVPKLKTIALHFGQDYPNELAFAREVAQFCGTDHEEFEIRPQQFLPELRRMIWHLDDPIGDPITMPNYQLAAYASRYSPWIFNGEGGDPCFGGPKNIPMMMSHWYGGVERGPRHREREYLASYRRGYEELNYLLTPEVLAQFSAEEDLEGVLSPFFGAAFHSFLNKLMSINIRLKGGHLILPKVERMLAASGAIPLSPLFSADLIRLSFQLPPRLKLSAGVEKIVLKRAFSGRLPGSVIERPKSGMRVPVHFWFQGELKRYARRILNRREINRAGIFRYDRIKQLMDYSIEEGPGRYGLRLWMLLTFEIWRRLVVENEPV